MTFPIRSIFCSFCSREFRGTNPAPARDRHESFHRSEIVLAVSTGAS